MYHGGFDEMGRVTTTCRAAAVLTLAALAGTAPKSNANPAVEMKPYTARYQVSYRGLNGGEIESSFQRANGNGLWRYETRAYPSILGRIAVSPQARETSTVLVSADSVRPMSFNFDDGSASSTKDVKLAYDWSKGKVTGTADGKPVDITLLPDTQDTASVQAAMIQALLAGQKPQAFPIITGGKLREYRYWFEGVQQVMTPLGKVDAEVWANQRDGSTRVTKTWHVPSLGYVPVQAIQYRKGKAEVHMKLVALRQ
jgi:hypothetical protein